MVKNSSQIILHTRRRYPLSYGLNPNSFIFRLAHNLNQNNRSFRHKNKTIIIRFFKLFHYSIRKEKTKIEISATSIQACIKW